MALIAAIVGGGIAGCVVESGKRGLLKTAELPAVLKLLLLAVLLGVPAIHAGSLSDYAVAVLVTIGAFTVARWSVASIIVLWGLRR